MFTETLLNNMLLWLYAGLFAAVLLGYLVPYLVDSHSIRSNGVTGPFLARLSDAWLAWVAAQANRSIVVHELHGKYGPFVRLAPNHVSISDPEALHIVYGHGNGALKSDFYDAFLSISRSIFTTRSRAEHTRKRKFVSHVFSPKTVLEFEPVIRLHIGELLERWDRLCESGRKGVSGSEGEASWIGHSGRVWFNCMPWFNYLAFDIIGDLAFGSPFGMIHNARDAAPVAVDQKTTMAGYAQATKGIEDDALPVCEVKEVPAVKILNGRSEYSASLGVLPPWVRPLAHLLPFYASGSKAVEALAGIAVAAVAKRLASPTDRIDLLSKLQQGNNEVGRPLGSEELSAEALTFLVAGSDTTANTACAIAYHLAANPRVQAKLQKELDEAFGVGESENPVSTYEKVKRLPYLEAVINEGLRVHSTAGIGLPRLVPEGGLSVCGKTFPEGTVLSVPTYTIHRDPDVWGADVDVFRPERWFERDQAILQKVFNPFSFGPRACLGRNLAITEQLLIISSIFRRFDITLEQPGTSLEIHEGFIRKPMACHIGMKRRDV